MAETIDQDARWAEIQRMSDEIANRDSAPYPLESALCGAVWRVRQAESEKGALREALVELIEATEALYPAYEQGQAAQDAWSARRTAAYRVARAALRLTVHPKDSSHG